MPDATMIRLIIPVLILQIALIIVALRDLFTRKKFVGSSLLLWVLIILIFPILGALVYFVIGRKE